VVVAALAAAVARGEAAVRRGTSAVTSVEFEFIRRETPDQVGRLSTPVSLSQRSAGPELPFVARRE